jgi:hypothetical protein
MTMDNMSDSVLMRQFSAYQTKPAVAEKKEPTFEEVYDKKHGKGALKELVRGVIEEKQINYRLLRGTRWIVSRLIEGRIDVDGRLDMGSCSFELQRVVEVGREELVKLCKRIRRQPLTVPDSHLTGMDWDEIDVVTAGAKVATQWFHISESDIVGICETYVHDIQQRHRRCIELGLTKKR